MENDSNWIELEDKKKNLIPEVNEKIVTVNSLKQDVDMIKSKVNQCELRLKDQNHHLVRISLNIHWIGSVE